MTASTPKIRVMIVDDSTVVRSMLTRVFRDEPDIEIVSTAGNGVQAILVLEHHPADIILLDIEMPEMDGLTALPKLLELSPSSRVIIVSTLSQRGAEISLRALELGAVDYVPKPSSRDAAGLEAFHRELKDKVRGLGSAGKALPSPSPAASLPVSVRAVNQTSEFMLPKHEVRAIAIGCSTGGPQALLAVFAELKNALMQVPVFITQHMPPTFTAILAEHLGKSSGKPCREAKEGESVEPGHVYVAPGDFHMKVVKVAGTVRLHLDQQPPVNFCRPSVEPMFQSLAEVYGQNLLAVMMTGMGHDGVDGARKIVESGGSVVAQDEASCVVWGMPKAVVDQQLALTQLPLGKISSYLKKACGEAS